jgi:hypothetical protein
MTMEELDAEIAQLNAEEAAYQARHALPAPPSRIDVETGMLHVRYGGITAS